MATDSMFLRLVGGNTISPQLIDNKISAHTIIAALQMWSNGEISKANIIAQYDFTHADDSDDLDNLTAWYAAAENQEKFSDILEWRIILARDKRIPGGGVGMDGAFGYAVKSALIGGADGTHSLRNTGPAPERFNSWA